MEIMEGFEKYQIEDGIFEVHKPVGISSFGLLRKLWGLFGTRKIGHAGTLDPLASGLLIVGVGKGTKKITKYLKLPKTYHVEIFLGKSTTTLDEEGEVTAEKQVYKADISERVIEDTLQSMVGENELQVPLYSAIKVQGKALYQYARKEQEPEYIPTKKMIVTRVQLLDHYRTDNYYIVKARFEVSSGTYIRTLAEEFGRRLGYPAFARALYRVAIDEYLDQDALRIPLS